MSIYINKDNLKSKKIRAIKGMKMDTKKIINKIVPNLPILPSYFFEKISKNPPNAS